ncbi:MAG: AMP-binding protein [Anaerolineales bacterium]
MVPFLRDEIEGDLGRRFRLVARQFPGNTAIKTSEAAVSYAELDAVSEDIARLLLSRRGAAEEPVALLLAEGIESWAAILGIVKAGKSVVLLSPDFQPSRLAAVWQDAGQPPVLFNSSTRSLSAPFDVSPDLLLDLDQTRPPAAGVDEPRISAGTLSVVSYTSGSTGEPKGVMWSHRYLLETAWYNHERYRLSETDRFTYFSAYGFSAGLIQGIVALLNGTTLYPFGERMRDVKALAAWLRRERMTILHLTSFGMLRQQADAMRVRADLPDLRCVLLSGEEMYRQDLDRIRAFFPESVEYSYRYAGSETSMISEARILPESAIVGGKIPAGFPVPDKEVLLLDPAGQPVPAGETGEIAVRSRYLADGYWRQPGLTQTKFRADPEGGARRTYLTGDIGRLLPDGQLLYLGRKDNVVRIRGFNVHLEAVDAALQRLPGVRQAAAAAHILPGGDKRLVAYLVPAAGVKPSLQELRRELKGMLPEYMVPNAFQFLDSLPRTPMERVDRTALPAPETVRPDLGTPFMEPRDDVEKRFCALWAGLIGVNPVGVDDDFFLLGGDSLLAMNMALAVEKTFHWQIPSDFFRKPTVRRLAELWRTDHAESEKASSGSSQGPAPQAGREGRESGTPSPGGRKEARRKRRASIGAKILNRSLRVFSGIPPEIALHLSYERGCRMLSGWCRRRWFIERVYAEQRDLFRRFVESLGGCPEAPADAFAIAVMSHLIWSPRQRKRLYPRAAKDFEGSLRDSRYGYWRDMMRILEREPLDRMDRWFSVSGLEHLEQAFRRGRGVVLVTYHSTVMRFANLALPRRLNCAPIQTISFRKALTVAGIPGGGSKAVMRTLPAETISAASADFILQGYRLLAKGGIVQVVPDSMIDPASPMPVNIAGREYRIKAGFAELALHAGAAVVPLYTTRRRGGRIHTAIHPPLDPGPESGERPERIYGLLRQYAAFVGRSWRAAPESVKWKGIRRHFQQPPAAKDTDDGFNRN